MSHGRCIVVGRGVIGWAVAFELACRGWEVVVVGPRHRAGGAASRAAGAMLGVLGEVTALPDDPASATSLDLRIHAGAMYEGWLGRIAAHGGRAPTPGCGTFVVTAADREQDARALRAMCQLGEAHKLRVEHVAVSAVPGLSPSPAHAPGEAVFLADERWVDAAALLDALHDASVALGVATVEDEVAGLLNDHRVRGVRTASGSIEADEVVLCAGTAVGEIAASLGAAPLMPEVVCAKGVSMLIRARPVGGPLTAHALRTPNREFACGLHLLPRPDGSHYLGATNRASRISGVTGSATADELAYLLDGAAEELVAGVRSWERRSCAHGERPLSVDRLPIAGRTVVAGLSVATGTYRDGILLAPLIADTVARELSDGSCARVGVLSPSAPSRPRLAPPTPAELLAEGRAQLVEMARRRPAEAHWLDTLERAFNGLAGTTLGRDRGDRVRRRAETFLHRYPLVEMVPELLLELAHEQRGSGVPTRARVQHAC